VIALANLLHASTFLCRRKVYYHYSSDVLQVSMKILLLIVRFQEYLEEDSYKEVEDLAGRLQAYKGNKIPLVVL